MDNDKSKSDSAPNKAESTSGCGPGCNCGEAGIGKKWKIVICLAVAIAATAVLANGIMQKTETQVGQGQSAFAAPVLAAEKTSPPGMAEKANETANSSLWGKPLESITSLNEMAVQKDAVFLYLPVKGQGPDEGVKKEIESAAGKAQSQGTVMALYTLDEGSNDYAQVASQVSPPCVLAMVKGGGSSAVSGNISEGNLLQALVSASRPSGCSPGGCAVPC